MDKIRLPRVPSLHRVPTGVTVLLVAGALAAQTCGPVSDVNRTIAGGLSSTPDGWATAGGWSYFAASTRVAGRELWRVNTSGTTVELVSDLHPGPADSDPRHLTACGSWVYFTADDGTHGTELWRTNGATTALVRDIREGVQGSAPTELTCCNGVLFFTAVTDLQGRELWRTSGTGAFRIRDIRPGTASSTPSRLTCCRDTVLFAANDGTSGIELWQSDGTRDGTQLVHDIRSGPASSSPGNLLCCPDGRIYFSADDGRHGTELHQALWFFGTWIVRLVKDIRPGNSGAGLRDFVCCDDELLFVADDGTSGAELWSSAGTSATTRLVRDIATGAAASNPSDLVCCGKTLFFGATTAATGHELWQAERTMSGTWSASLVLDVRSGSSGSLSASPTANNQFACLNGTLLFRANDGTTGFEPWRSDGTAAGTFRLRDIYRNTDNSFPRVLGQLGNTLAFSAADGSTGGTGRELWRTDGSTAGTVLVRDIEPRRATSSSNPNALTSAHGRELFFAADDGVSGNELYRWNARSGVTALRDILPGPSGSQPSDFVTIDGEAFFAATGPEGRELWRSDGTMRGTVLAADVRSGPESSSPRQLTRVGETLVFTADDGVRGIELWRWTPRGAVLVRDIESGAASSTPGWLTPQKSRLFFVATERSRGRELWVHDVEEDKTFPLRDIESGPSSSSPAGLVACDGFVYFHAQTAASGRELWRSSGTIAGTSLVRDLWPGADSGIDRSQRPVCWRDRIYFGANARGRGVEPWVSDGSSAGTALLREIEPGPASSRPADWRATDTSLFFVATDSSSGTELWRTDGTSAGTQRARDIRPGPGGSSPRDLTRVGRWLYFGAGATTRSLWRTDGSAVERLCAGLDDPGELTVCDGRLFFAADAAQTGRELHEVRRPGASTTAVGGHCSPDYASMTATAPVLGATSLLSGRCAPSGHIGVVLMSPPRSTPTRLPTSPCSYWVSPLGFFWVHGALAPSPNWQLPFPVPDIAGLEGTRVLAQAVFLRLGSTFPTIQSNAVLLGIGR